MTATDPAEGPAWRRRTQAEQRWPASITIAVLAAIQWFLPDELTVGPRWLLPVIELAIGVVLIAANPVRMRTAKPALRALALALISVVGLGTAYSVVMLIYNILTGYHTANAADLLGAGAGIYVMNILTFSVLFWEFDRGGPIERGLGTDPFPDFLFPQMTMSGDMVKRDWEPYFLDYLYVAFTNATAFSPTDTMPLSRWAKAAMALESAIALATAALVIAKAVNTLG
ncbi:hypothetical protein HH310_34570 [Actinoplanes sp. TBRC 11911]|uniref:hypothetical protein n=1 Tax=Actinoplanes sp. TBRC 11911 TaxID=2729386 RepID=UPI00145E2C07|nr:hypothetical protein [Actinoplanes sp. TBRC 11911]NMO56289.1 hypothetical protein [Actinoplanes sp. TBRC 11911]